jgi:hypothetical protein
LYLQLDAALLSVGTYLRIHATCSSIKLRPFLPMCGCIGMYRTVSVDPTTTCPSAPVSSTTSPGTSQRHCPIGCAPFFFFARQSLDTGHLRANYSLLFVADLIFVHCQLPHIKRFSTFSQSTS